MLLQEIDLLRFIQIYIAQLGVGGIYFLILAILVLRRSTKNLNKIFAMFFISVAAGTITNVIYANLLNAPLVKFLHILTVFLFCWAMIYLFLFNLIILRSEQQIVRNKQILVIVIWTLIISVLFIIGLLGGVTIDESTNWSPVWELSFFLYVIIVCLLGMTIPTMYLAIQIYNQFEDEMLKKKWKFFLIGIVCFYVMLAGTGIANFLAETLIRNIWGIIAMVSFLAIYTLYYGVGKQIED